MLTRARLYIIYIIGVLLAGCTSEPEMQVGFPISICLPAEEIHTPMNRLPGDPGTTEQFLLPNYIYIFIVKQKPEPDESWVIQQTITKVLTDKDWEKTHYVGLLPTMGDSIYRYTEELNLLSNPGEEFHGRVYIIASPAELSFTKDIAPNSPEADLLAQKFSTNGAMQAALPHIYSTPYNLEVDGQYYGFFSFINQKVPHLNLLLYHVAAKVDIKWYVPEDKRIDREIPDNGIRLTYMKAVNLFDGYAYCFRPMEDTVTSMPTGGHSILINDNNEGLWWEGRDYFYTIPFTVNDEPETYYFPLQMKLCTNGTDTAHAYKATLNLRIDPTSPFVPWLRADFNINSKLAADDSSTQYVD